MTRIAVIVGTQSNDRVRRLRFSDVTVPMKRVEWRKRIGRCDKE
ncbi:hypothetical protein ACVWVY_005932 [Bradyrhizobium sp. URHC0002]